MIKLNNKNITYVALADSNNSVKGVKEIWYADTNNSVKLVYRRKDALIEGEDYEKYHWLRAEMPLNKLLMTLSVNSNNVDFYIKRLSLGNITILITNGYKYFFWNNAYEIGSFGNGADVEHHTYSSDTQLFHIVTNSTNVLINSIQFNSVGFPIRSINFITEPNGNEGVTLTSTISVDEIERYIPCKLLKPVPKWLDANGIRRQVGECGMIDLVSGKFYGNVNSVGTFTVENYYERKEWLVGDGSAYIDTNIIVDVPTLHYNVETILNTASVLCGSRNANGNNSSSVSVFTPTRLRLDIFDSTTYADFSGGVIDVDVPNKVITINDVPFTTTRTNFGNANYSFRIFDLYYRDNYNDVPCGTMKIHYFSITDNSHNLSLIPCTLTMDLPASMDANNIARTKGTSGMWDLVSDRFYGNVANSGTFKAVNLAEGVDYEVHQWLKGDGTAYIDTLVSDLSNVKEIYCKIKPFYTDNIGKERIFGRETVSPFADSRFVVYNSSSNYMTVYTATRYSSLSFSAETGWVRINTESNIASTSQSASAYIENINKNGVSLGLFADHTSTSGFSAFYKGSIGEFTIDDSLRLTPVRLLRPIPAALDANGIARQAGECGMYDTVNDVFYGNVASSGSFTVSND